MKKEHANISILRDKLLFSIQNEISDCTINGNIKKRLAGNLNLCFKNINNEALIASMPSIAFSSGAACASSKMEASHVLLALGLSKKEAFSSIRFGIGRFNKEEEIEKVTKKLKTSVEKLRSQRFF